MAFNPFHSFRKNSKYVFAALAIICMFTFVLSSGLGQGGDFFDWLGRMLGRTDHRKGAEVAKIYDKPVYEADLAAIRTNRQVANAFMTQAAIVGDTNLMRQLQADVQAKRLGDDVSRVLDKIVAARLRLSDPNLGQFAEFQYNQQLIGFLLDLQKMLRGLKPEERKADYQAVSEALGVVNHDFERMTRRQFGVPTDLYFTNMPMGGPRESLLFELFLRKADQMGVPRLNNDDVRNLVNAETNNRVREADFAAIEQTMRRVFRGANTDQLMAALADEFRVRIAQTSMFGKAVESPLSALFGAGRGPVLASQPGYMTPYEFYQFYRDNCTPITVGVIAVPAQAFVAKVAEAPPEGELRSLYNQYRTFEPDPAREHPGFKEPRKIKLEWVGLSPDLPYYAKKLDALNAAAPALAGPVFPKALDSLAYESRYNRAVERQRTGWDAWLTDDVHDSSVLNPLTIATLTGHLAAAGQTRGNELPGLASFFNMAKAVEVRDRTKVGVQLLLGPAQPLAALPMSPPSGLPPRARFAPGALGATASGVAAYELDRKYRTREPAPLPLTAIASAAAALPSEAPLRNLYRAEITRQLRDERLRNLFMADVAKFESRVAELAKGKDGKAAAGKYIAEFIKERGAKHGASAAPDDRFTIAKDPGLKPLTDLDQPKADPLRPTEPGGLLARLFFAPSPSSNTLYQPEWFPSPPVPTAMKPGETSYLAWRTEDKPPRIPGFEQARPQVEAAWRLAKARGLAKKAADDLAAEAKGLKGNPKALKDFALRKGYPEFQLGPMARLQNVHGFEVNSAPGVYSPYRVPAALVAHPGQQFVDELLALRDKPVGDALVVADQPKDHYYVAVLEDRTERTPEDFMRVYQMTNLPPKVTNPASGSQDTLYSQHARPEAQRKARQEVIARLKLEANYSENEEVLKRLEESANRARLE